MDILKEIFTKDKPIGPEKIEKIDPVKELLITNNLPYKNLLDNPNVIIGRRGSGKSSIIKSYYVGSNRRYHSKLIYTFPIETGISAFISDLNIIVKDVHLVENVAPIWKFLIWIGFLHSVSKTDFDFVADSNEFLSALGIPENSSNEEAIFTGVDLIKMGEIRTSIIDKKRFGPLSLDDLINIINAELTRKKLAGIILIDSLEHLQLDLDSMHPALGGFLSSFAEFKLPQSKIKSLCCIPAEIYFALHEEISSAPIKDFADSQVLHWSASEILHIVANRLSTYLRVHGDGKIVNWLGDFDLNKKKDISRFFHNILPNIITNGVNIEEEPLGYIMRHTQLLPRHAVIYFNAIFSGYSPWEIIEGKVSSDKVVTAIHGKETQISNDIIDGYRNSYHHKSDYIIFTHARMVCELMLKELSIEFNMEEFMQVYARHVANVIPAIFDYRDAMRVLVELGAVGRSIGSDTERYKRGLFEYTSPYKLVTTSRDTFLIHPCFVAGFCHIPKNLNFAVYPFGADVDESEYRQWAHEAS